MTISPSTEKPWPWMSFQAPPELLAELIRQAQSEGKAIGDVIVDKLAVPGVEQLGPDQPETESTKG